MLTTKTKRALLSALVSEPAKKDLVKALGIGGATFVIGAEAANVINVGIQLTDDDGNDLDAVTAVEIWLFADAAGVSINTNAYDTIAIGTDGLLVERVADKIIDCTCESDGDIDIDLTEATATPTIYVGVKMGDGSFVISGAVAHA
jgi:hypothetical protein